MLVPVDQRTLVKVPVTLQWQPVDGAGVPAEPAGTVTVNVASADGTVVASGLTTTGADNAVRVATLPAADNQQLDRLTVSWLDDGDVVATTVVDVVGGYMFAVGDLRVWDGLALADAQFGDQQIVEARQVVEDLIEWSTGTSWRPQFQTTTTRLDGYRKPWLAPQARALRWVIVDDVARDVAQFALDHLDRLTDVFGNVPGAGRYSIGYEAGFFAPPPSLRDAGIQACRFKLLGDNSGLSPRARGYTTDFGNISYSSATKERPFGIDTIDAVVVGHRQDIPLVA